MKERFFVDMSDTEWRDLMCKILDDNRVEHITESLAIEGSTLTYADVDYILSQDKE